MKDAAQKEMIFKHFTAQGWYALVEIPVFPAGGLDEENKVITDIDVLGLRPGSDLRWELVLGDCKTLKGQSPANRAVWLRGLMDRISASSGIILLQRKKGNKIEPDHKLFAGSLGINLLDEVEFNRYDRALVYPSGSAQCIYTAKELIDIRDLIKRFPPLGTFVYYIYAKAWNEPSHWEILRKILGQAKAIRREIDPERSDHLAIILEGVSVFSIALATCVGLIFTQYLMPETKARLDEALKVVIWGGRSQYQFISKLRSDLLIAKGQSKGEETPLALPQWDSFLQLVRESLEAPKISFQVPQILRLAALDLIHNRSFLQLTGKSELLILKRAELTVRYFCQAAELPPDTWKKLGDKFAQRQSDILHEKTDPNYPQPALPYNDRLIF